MSGTNEGPEFETPGGGNPAGPAQGAEGAFSPPSAEELGAASDDQDMQAMTAGLPEDLLFLKAEIESALGGMAAACSERGIQSVEDGNITGVGLTLADASDITSGLAPNVAPGQAALAVFTIERQEAAHLQAAIASIAGTQALSAAPIVQVPVGIIEAQPHRFRIRPAPGGVSVAHHAVTAGTLGCLSIGLQPPRNSRLMVLSNNHVLANSNDARLGDCICQPGPADGGRCPADQIAILERFVPINFSGGVNYVDCATGWAWPDRVRRELIYLSGGQQRFFRVSSAPVAPQLGMVVGKSGRTTQLTRGEVRTIAVTVNVGYGGGKVGRFADQIAIRAPSGDFSAGGDSGSLVWQWAGNLPPVGLLFAGGGGWTFANRITRVLSALDIRLYT